MVAGTITRLAMGVLLPDGYGGVHNKIGMI